MLALYPERIDPGSLWGSAAKASGASEGLIERELGP